MLGTISDLDPEDFVGLIKSDDGRVLFFDLNDTRSEWRRHFAVGQRLHFSEMAAERFPKAEKLIPVATPDHLIELSPSRTQTAPPHVDVSRLVSSNE